MKAYVITTGLVFALVTVAHVARVFMEDLALARSPEYVVITLFTAGLSVWAWRVLRGLPK